MDKRFLRLIYIGEFLLAVIAVFTLWSQVGGQTHLDMMAWYLKAILGLGMAYGTVRATAAAFAGERAWNGRSLAWTGVVVVLAIAAGLVTYYYHINEPEEEEDQPSETAITPAAPRQPRQAAKAAIINI